MSSAKRPRVPCFMSPAAVPRLIGVNSVFTAPLSSPLAVAPRCRSKQGGHDSAAAVRVEQSRSQTNALASPPVALKAEGSGKADRMGNISTSGEESENRALLDAEDDDTQSRRPRRKLSAETKRKIAFAMIGQRKSDEMRAKVSQKLKGRVPWNKGKKLSAETRARMSEARSGSVPWNKGKALTIQHRRAIAAAGAGVERLRSVQSRLRRRMARRRPGDAIVSGGGPSATENGTYPLVETADINTYVTLRRELRGWSDQFAEVNSRRPSLADVRRNAPPQIIRQFERYVGMRDRIRGLAADVYGTINPTTVPVVSPKITASAPQNNNAGSVVEFTSNGNPRLVPRKTEVELELGAASVVGDEECQPLIENDVFVDGATSAVETVGGLAASDEAEEGGKWGQWDIYDTPTRGDYSSGFQVTGSLAPRKAPKAEEVSTTDRLSPSDYRAIGKYRLIESVDINRYVQLRKDLVAWSVKFKKTHGHTPALSDVRAEGDPLKYRQFCEYVRTRDHMDGLVKEVVGVEVDDVEQIKAMSKAGRRLVDQLRPKSPEGTSSEHTAISDEMHAERRKNRSPPSEWAS